MRFFCWYQEVYRSFGIMVRRSSGLALVLVLSGVSVCGSGDERPLPKGIRGFSYQHEEVRVWPWSIHIVKVDRSNADLQLQTTLGRGDQIGTSVLTDQIRTIPPEFGRPIAAINGDYFHRRPYLGDPKGMQVLRGELVSGPCDWTCFWIDPSGNPHMTNVVPNLQVTWPNGQKTPFGLNEDRAPNMPTLYTSAVGNVTRTSGGRELVLEQDGTNSWLPLQPGRTYSARIREVREGGNSRLSRDTMVLSLERQALSRAPKLAKGAVLQISTATFPDLSGVQTAIGGGPPIVRDGKSVVHTEAYVKHPRSAVGWNKDYYFLVEVDGRQRNLSVGMTLPELADYMIKLGCTDAMNLDGGGSSECWVYGEVMNSPSEGGERPMANALVLMYKEKK